MPKSPEGYHLSQEEIQEAGGTMTTEQQKLSELRTFVIGEIGRRINLLTTKQAEDTNKFYEEEGEEVSELHESGLRYKQEQESAELYAQLAEEATRLYETDPNKAKEFALYAATYFSYDNRSNDSFEHFGRALEQLAKEMANHGHSIEIVEIIKNLPTSDGDESSFKTNLLLRTAAAVEGKDRDTILTYAKSLIEPRIVEDYSGDRALDWRYQKHGQGESLDYRLVSEFFGEEYALSVANQEVPNLDELDMLWEFHGNDWEGHKPRVYALYHILGPKHFAKEMKNEISGNAFRDVVLTKKVYQEGEWTTQAEVEQKLSEIHKRGMGNRLELRIEQGKRGLLASAIRFVEDRASHISFLREHYPDQVDPRETEEAVAEALSGLKSFRLKFIEDAINNLSPNETLDLKDALEMLHSGDKEKEKVNQTVGDRLLRRTSYNNIYELLYLLGEQQNRNAGLEVINHALDKASKKAKEQMLFDPDRPFYPGDGRPLAAGFHDISPVKIKLGLGGGRGVEVEVDGWAQSFYRGNLSHVIVRTTDGRQYNLWGKDEDEVIKNNVPGFERAWTR